MNVRSRAIGENRVSFRDELPVPVANVDVYEQIYVLEQWLRRLAYAALLALHGNQWKGVLPSSLLPDLKRRLNQLSGRVHLDCENSDNMIWLLTLEELRDVLLAESTWPVVRGLTGLPQDVLGSKLAELREIRNVVGHNRAISANTALIADAVAVSLQVGIARFKAQLLYSEASVIHLDNPGEVEGLRGRFAELTWDNDWSRFQPMLSESAYFFSLTRLPADPLYSFLAVKRFLARLGMIEQDLLAILVNKLGNEFTLVWPKRANPDVHERVLQFFLESHSACWTTTPYANQRTSAICDPCVWFYENQRPSD